MKRDDAIGVLLVAAMVLANLYFFFWWEPPTKGPAQEFRSSTGGR